MVTLDGVQARVVGSLIEKQLTTPQQYPLSLNALTLACNQTSNRDPVVAFGEDQVAVALDQLRDLRLVRFVLPSHGRSVVRYRHVLDETLGVDPTQLAVLAVLLLRGPQTSGELRIRTDRMASFDSLGAVEHELGLLSDMEPPLVVRLPRRPGQKEERWADRLQPSERSEPPEPSGSEVATSGSSEGTGTPVDREPVPAVPPGSGLPATRAGSGSPATESAAAVVELRQELARLGAEVAALRAELQALRDSLGG